MSEQPALSPSGAQAVVGLCRTLLVAARSWAMYPPDHPAARTAVLRLQTAVADAVGEKVAGGISVTPTTLLVHDRPAPDELPVAEAAGLLHDRGVLRIGFDAVLPVEALGRLLTFLAAPPDEVRAQGGVDEVWQRRGHPAILLEAIDYEQVLADRESSDAATRHDDVWQTIVAALSSGRRTLDEREQQRLLELAENPAELADLARTVMADKCAADGSPMVTTQAATVLASYRHLLSLAGVLAPERVSAILANVGSALLDLHPHVSLQVLSLDGTGTRSGDAQHLAAAIDEEGAARLLATSMTIDSGPSPHLAQVFDLIVPDRGDRRRVVERAQVLAKGRGGGALWHSVEQLLVSYDDQPFVSDEYRAVLERTGQAGGTGLPTAVPEMGQWLEGLAEGAVRHLSIALLADLLRLEPQADRARAVVAQLAALVDDLLLAGAYADTLEVLEALREATAREGLAAATAEALTRAGGGQGMREAADMLGALTEEEWAPLDQCCAIMGRGCFGVLRRPLLEDRETAASRRAGDVLVAAGGAAVPELCALLADPGGPVRSRLAALLGRIGSPAAVPSLQALFRTREPDVLRAAVRALAAIDDPSAARAIHVALRATGGEARRAIVEALVAAGDRRVVPMLVRVLESSRPLAADHQVALDALEALGLLRDGRAVPAVTAVMRTGTWLRRRRLRTLRRSAVRALVAIGDRGAGQALDEAASEGDRMLRRLVRDIRAREVPA